MSSVIYKYPLDGSEAKILLPVGSQVVHFEKQGDSLCIWIHQASDITIKETRIFTIFGTGHDIPDDWVYVATTQDPPFVWHLCELMGD